MKDIVLGNEKVAVTAFQGEDEFAIIGFVEPEPDTDIRSIPLEDHEVAIHFKTKRDMNRFISHLIEVKKYLSLEDCDENTN